jgi:hypothetical protein
MSWQQLLRAMGAPLGALVRFVWRRFWRVMRVVMFALSAVGPAAPARPLPRVQPIEASADSERDAR